MISVSFELKIKKNRSIVVQLGCRVKLLLFNRPRCFSPGLQPERGANCLWQQNLGPVHSTGPVNTGWCLSSDDDDDEVIPPGSYKR